MRTLGLFPAAARDPRVSVCSSSAPRFHVITVLLYIVPFQLSSASLLQRGLIVLPRALFNFQCYSFHRRTWSYYGRNYSSLTHVDPLPLFKFRFLICIWVFTVSLKTLLFLFVLLFFFPLSYSSLIFSYPFLDVVYFIQFLSGMLNFIVKEQMSCLLVTKSSRQDVWLLYLTTCLHTGEM